MNKISEHLQRMTSNDLARATKLFWRELMLRGYETIYEKYMKDAYLKSQKISLHALFLFSKFHRKYKFYFKISTRIRKIAHDNSQMQ